MQSLPGENPPEHEVPYLKSSGADVAAVISPQCLLVPRRSQRGFSATFLPQHEVYPRMASCCASSNARTRAERL